MRLERVGLLNDERVSDLRAPGRYSDGQRLSLHVYKNGYRHWIFRFTWEGKERVVGLGSPDGKNPVFLADVRLAADRLREQIAAGRAPVRAKEARQYMRALRADEGGAKPAPKFGAYARYYANYRAPWRHDVGQAAEWMGVMRVVFRDALSRKPVTDVALSDVLQILRRHARSNMARGERIRAALEEVLTAAYSDLGIKRSNPARLRGNVERFTPKEVTGAAPERAPSTRKSEPDKIKSGHRSPAQSKPRRARVLSPQLQELRIFVDRLRLQQSVLARAIEFAALTALRLHDVLDLIWGNVSFADQCLHLTSADPPAGLSIPLSASAMRIIRGLKRHSPDQNLFRSAQSRNGALVYHRTVSKARMPQIQFNSFRRLFDEWAWAMGPDFAVASARYLAATDSFVPLQLRAEMLMCEEVHAVLVAWDQFLASP